MPLNFPEVKDIHLANSPLREVICQVKFPRILRIAREEPVEFQERIRTKFPVMEVEHSVVLEPEKIRPEVLIGVSPPVCRFYNRERTFVVSLGTDFYALSTKTYTQWIEFANHLAFVAEIVQDIYKIPYATRIGLRYINVLGATFSPSGKFDDVFDLLREELTVMLRTDAILSPDLALQQIQTTEGEDRFTFRYGLTREGTPPEPKFLLDFDVYTENETGLENLLARCDNYHQIIYKAFRWCIAEGKLAVFQPVEKEA